MNYLKRISPQRLGVLLFILITTLATLVRVLWIVYIPNTPISDFDTYQQLAENVSRGLGHTLNGQPIAMQGAAYPIVLGIIYKLIGSTDIFVGKMFNVLLSVTTLVIIYFILKKMFTNRYIIYLSYFFIAFLPNYVAYNSVIGTEVFMCFLFSLIILLQIRMENKYRKYAVIGLVVGVAALTKPIFLAYPVILTIIDWLNRKKFKEALAFLFICCIGMSVVLTPWIVRNYKAYDTIFPISYNGGYVLYINNNDQNINGLYLAIENVVPSEELLTQLEEKGFDYGVHHPQVEKLYQSEAIHWIFKHPIKFLELGLLRVANTFFSGAWDITTWTVNQEELASMFNHSLSFYRSFAILSTINNIIISVLSVSGLLFIILYSKHIITVTFSRDKLANNNILIVFTNILFFTATYFVYEGQPRYNFPVLFVLAIAAVVIAHSAYVNVKK